MSMGYASRTGTRRNLQALADAGWRLLVSAAADWRTEGFAYGLDNGAWPAHVAGRPCLDEEIFGRALIALGAAADWVVVPDIVMGGGASLTLSRWWLPRVLDQTQLALIAVQDGMTSTDVDDLVGERVGIFVGGSTEWKKSSLPIWAALKRDTGCYLHVGRVNSVRRIALCMWARADSFDGTSVTRFATTLPRLDLARYQPDMFS